MNLGLDLLGRHYAFDDAVRAYDESGAHCAEVFATVHALFSPHSEFFHQSVVSIAYEGEGKLMFVSEFLMGGHGVDAHADHLIAGLQQLPVAVTQAACLRSAAAGVVFRIEI